MAAELRLDGTITLIPIRRREPGERRGEPHRRVRSETEPGPDDLTAGTLTSHMRLSWSHLTPTSQELPGFLTDFGLKFCDFGKFAIG
ncbi:hypothetical protein MGALJ_52420 [Mycobacterium gallinarum]|uniref:Uncharacterized protein n=1 Tax=Mycobacterium gallinarum TaxID=39689 RepID=A0A9W4FIA4_9MYCO|nr:hypothetical protein MGALJ_52420 [Mycobacterium gallinarum]